MKSVLKGQLKAGLDSVRSTKLRSFWTMLGVIIGVASVISVVAIGEGIKQQVSGQLHQYGTSVIVVRPAQLQAGNNTNGSASSVLSGVNISAPLTAKDITTVAMVHGVTASAPLTIVNGSFSAEAGSYHDGLVIGSTSALPSLINQSLSNGDFLNTDDVGQHVVVLGATVAQELFNEDVPLGHSLTFHGQQFIVQGIFNKFTMTPLSQQVDFNKAIFIPNDVAESLSDNTAPTYEILARASAPSQAMATVKRIQSALDVSHGGTAGFSVLTGSQDQAANNAILELLTRLIAGVAAISLLVGGVGIMNVMLVSVSERMHEIGIRKAVGATNRQILVQFMLESTLLSLTGGIIGIILALLTDLGLRLATNLKPSINWQIVVLASGVSLLIGVIFGTVPAVKAARKDPIEALRSE